MLGFVLEARTLRPDVLLTACTVTAVLCWHLAEHGPERRRTAWLIGLYAALGVGMMAKGLPPVVAAGIPIGVDTLHRHGWRGIGRLRPGLALVVFTVIVLPWHLIVALRTPGFAWDYIVNQHLLALIGKKQPRDSVGVSLGTFWGAFIARGSPWIVFVPLTIREALRSRGMRPSAARPSCSGPGSSASCSSSRRHRRASSTTRYRRCRPWHSSRRVDGNGCTRATSPGRSGTPMHSSGWRSWSRASSPWSPVPSSSRRPTGCPTRPDSRR